MAFAWRHQAITWTNVDLSSVRSSSIHLRAILQEIPQLPVTEISLKITYLKYCSNFPGANELTEFNEIELETAMGVSYLWTLWCTQLNKQYRVHRKHHAVITATFSNHPNTHVWICLEDMPTLWLKFTVLKWCMYWNHSSWKTKSKFTQPIHGDG